MFSLSPASKSLPCLFSHFLTLAKLWSAAVELTGPQVLNSDQGDDTDSFLPIDKMPRVSSSARVEALFHGQRDSGR